MLTLTDNRDATRQWLELVSAGRIDELCLLVSTSWTLTHRGAVYPWHCDHMGHMNVMWYVGKFDEATWQLLGLLGLTAARLAQDGFGMAAVDQHVQYKREVRAGDLLAIRSTVLRVSEKSITFTHEMTNDATGEVAATTTLVGVALDTATRRARALPPDVHERAAALIADLGELGRRDFSAGSALGDPPSVGAAAHG